MRQPYPMTQLIDHEAKWRTCTRCTIGRTANKHVFVRGTVPCDVLFVGEGPGHQEDVTGEPFVGPAGQRLDEWISDAFDIAWISASARHREEGKVRRAPLPLTYAWTNIICCRPIDRKFGAKRDPTEDEIHNCEERLHEFFGFCGAKALVLVGRLAAMHLTPLQAFLPILHLVHPAFFLRTPSADDTTERNKLKEFLHGVAKRKHGTN